MPTRPALLSAETSFPKTCETYPAKFHSTSARGVLSFCELSRSAFDFYLGADSAAAMFHWQFRIVSERAEVADGINILICFAGGNVLHFASANGAPLCGRLGQPVTSLVMK
jgi:hypothetical protein